MSSIIGHGLRVTIGGKPVGVASQVSFEVEGEQKQEVDYQPGNFTFSCQVKCNLACNLAEEETDFEREVKRKLREQIQQSVVIVERKQKRIPRKTKKAVRKYLGAVNKVCVPYGCRKRIKRFIRDTYYAMQGKVEFDIKRDKDNTYIGCTMSMPDARYFTPGEEILSEAKRAELLRMLTN